MRSTYDRRGGNEGADASHFLYQLAEDQNVTLDVAGKGVLYFDRYNHWHGSPWHYNVDGLDHLVKESSTADPDHPKEGATFEPSHVFQPPTAVTWANTKGADLSWVPIPFESTFRMAYSRTHYGTGYYIYDQYVGGAILSQPIRSWNGNEPPDKRVIALINRAGTDIAPKSAKSIFGTIDQLSAGSVCLLRSISASPRVIRKITFSVPVDQAIGFGRTRLRITWDGRSEPSVDAPLALFYGAGTLYNRDSREYIVKALPTYIRQKDQRVELSCFFPMPFFESARIELIGARESNTRDIRWTVAVEPFKGRRNDVGYFHATYRDHQIPEPGHDLVLLDTHGLEGSQDWSGSFVGTSFIFSDRAALGTLEGDPRFFFDDSQTPQAYGTGTEEWGGGGDYWGGQNMTLPFAGHPVGARDAKSARSPEDLIESAYRFLLSDLMPFGRNARIQLEHGGEDDSTEHYQTVTYWYGAPAASLIKTDELKIGSIESEKSHAYRSPQASEPYSLTSRYEWGVDTRKEGGKRIEVFPAHTDTGRKTNGSSEFTLRIEPDNFGVLLRRKLDYAYPNQRADVSVADIPKIGAKARWKPAGVWYLAGSNTCVYSNPQSELGAAQHIVQTSNRRFRDDEFLIPRTLTQGRAKIEIRVVFRPMNLPLFPTSPVPEQAWSEFRYDAYCFVAPDWSSPRH